MKTPKKLIRPLSRFVRAYLHYLRSGKTPAYGYRAMRQLYCSTNGRLNNVVSGLQVKLRSNYKIDTAHGALGNLASNDLASIANKIRDNGYYLFPEPLPGALCDEIVSYALERPSTPRTDSCDEKVVYDRANPRALIYDFDLQTIIENVSIQHLLSDSSLIALAQEYLGAGPFLSMVAMWWSNARFKDKGFLSRAAQLYHFDLDRLKFLQFFIYLTDVTLGNGPHCFVKKSHGPKPEALREDRRFLDEEIFSHYPKDYLVEITGKKGTIFAADTSAFHKGKELEHGDRLILQIQFATSMFGQTYSKARANENFAPEFFRTARQYPRLYAGILESS